MIMIHKMIVIHKTTIHYNEIPSMKTNEKIKVLLNILKSRDKKI